MTKNFWAQIEKTATCWFWTGVTNTLGYGKIQLNKRFILVHRFMWRWFNGPIPDGLHVLHKCDEPLCVNPKHLFLGTQEDNVRDCIQKGRHRSGYGEKNRHAKLTEEDVKEIRKRIDMPAIALAKAFMVSINTIWAIKSLRSWKHVK
jgi:HNH endonuclease